MLPLERNNYLAVASIDMHDIHLNTQIRTIYIDISIVKVNKGKDMGRSREYKKCIKSSIHIANSSLVKNVLKICFKYHECAVYCY